MDYLLRRQKFGSLVFPTKKDCSVHQSAIREAPMVFSRLPSLMAAEKPCPLLQSSLHFGPVYLLQVSKNDDENVVS